jgi:hypothetical protein
LSQTQFGFMIVDADQTPIAPNPLVGRALSREAVVDTPLAQEVFDLVDAIWLKDTISQRLLLDHADVRIINQHMTSQFTKTTNRRRNHATAAEANRHI